MDQYIKLAKNAIETYVKDKKTLKEPKDLPAKMAKSEAGVFVSLHKKDGKLRGCIGTFFPTCKNIAAEIIQNAISTCSQDPRFLPVNKSEIDDLEISVDILSNSELATLAQLNPRKYGVIVKSSSGKIGLLLPDIEGVNNAKQQIEICKEKAGINKDEKIEIYRFTACRHKEK